MRTASNYRPRTENIEQSIERKLLNNLPLSEYEVAALFGVTRTRIRQIEQRALRKMKAALSGIEEDVFA